MNTLLSILLLTVFGSLLMVIMLFVGGIGIVNLLNLYGSMELCFLVSIAVLCLLAIYKVYKRYFSSPKAMLLWIGVECSSILLWVAFFYFDQELIDQRASEFLLRAVHMDGLVGDEGAINRLAVLCGIVYPIIGVSCLLVGLKAIVVCVRQTRQKDTVNY